MNLVFSSVFEADFAEITGRLAIEASTDISLRWENEVIRLVEQLLRHPELGRIRRDLQPAGIRSFRVKDFPNYLLFYQIKKDDLVFLRVRYGGMDLTALFHGD